MYKIHKPGNKIKINSKIDLPVPPRSLTVFYSVGRGYPLQLKSLKILQVLGCNFRPGT